MADKIPYGLIAQAFRSGKVVPFLGAGASAAHRGPKEEWEPGKSFCPLGDELAKHLATIGEFPDEKGTDDLMLVATYFQTAPASEAMLRRQLDQIFCAEGLAPGPIHRLLAQYPQVTLIITTNYDNLIEQAFNQQIHVMVDHGHGELVNIREKGREDFIRLVKKGKDLQKVFKSNPAPIVFKMHGAAYKLDPESAEDPEEFGPRRFVLTADDYVSVLEKEDSIPAYLSGLITGRSFLFLGYGLRDWNVRVLLSRFRNLANKSWAIQHTLLEAERKIWEHRGVNLYQCDLATFVANLGGELEKQH
jgi:hypothetical protein